MLWKHHGSHIHAQSGFLTDEVSLQEQESKLQSAELSLEDLPENSAGGSQRPSARLVLDDIDWNLVASKVGTRTRQQCMNRWYRCMAPSMVTRGTFSDHPFGKTFMQRHLEMLASVPDSASVIREVEKVKGEHGQLRGQRSNLQEGSIAQCALHVKYSNSECKLTTAYQARWTAG